MDNQQGAKFLAHEKHRASQPGSEPQSLHEQTHLEGAALIYYLNAASLAAVAQVCRLKVADLLDRLEINP